MSNEFDRLRQANPATELTYIHSSLSDVAARAARPEATKATRLAQGFRMKMASAALGAALLTTGAITALETSAPSLPVLAIGGGTHAAGASAPKSDALSMMPIMQNYRFIAGDGLSSNASQAPAFRLNPVADPTAFVLSMAKSTGIYDATINVDRQVDATATPETTPVSTTYTYTNNGASITLWNSSTGLSYWNFSKSTDGGSSSTISSTVSSSPTPSSPTKSDVGQWGEKFFSSLHLGFELGTPDVWIMNCTGCADGSFASVSFPVLVGGYATDISLGATFAANGDLVNAYGSAGSLEEVGPYPLVSERDGVTALAGQNDRYRYESKISDGVASTPASSGSGVSSSVPATPIDPTTTTVAPPVYDVTVDHAVVKLGTYTLADGSSWLIPIYEYHGTWQFDDGSRGEGTWSTVAVDQAYVQISTNGGAINGPIAY